MKSENIPKSVSFKTKDNNPFIPEDDIPIIYGSPYLKIRQSLIECGIDIFSSSFFMLTRWEEYVNKTRDLHNRFPAYASLSYKFKFLDRPIVNEYVEMLKNMLLKLNNNLYFKKHEFKFLLTHDVDRPLKYPIKYPNILIILIETMRDAGETVINFLNRGNIRVFSNLISQIKSNMGIYFGLQKDPFDNFDYLMDLSEEIGTKSYFFFMGRGVTKFDNAYRSDDQFIKELVRKIKQRGHYIGMHASYNSFNNPDQFRREKEELEKNLDSQISFGRQHYLRFEVPTTWQIWEDNGMSWDSTLSYADKEGFRCGTCYEFSVFNVLSRKKLKLKEKPLVVMEGSFVHYQPKVTPDEMEKKIIILINKVRKYNGEFVFLWHNSSFNTITWRNYQHIYESVLRKSSGI